MRGRYSKDMEMHVDNRAGERREHDRRQQLTSVQKVHLSWMLSEERRKNERREVERRGD
jgi:hypothetical protein